MHASACNAMLLLSRKTKGIWSGEFHHGGSHALGSALCRFRIPRRRFDHILSLLCSYLSLAPRVPFSFPPNNLSTFLAMHAPERTNIHSHARTNPPARTHARSRPGAGGRTYADVSSLLPEAPAGDERHVRLHAGPHGGYGPMQFRAYACCIRMHVYACRRMQCAIYLWGSRGWACTLTFTCTSHILLRPASSSQSISYKVK